MTKKQGSAKPQGSELHINSTDVRFVDTYTLRDYEVILDVLYGLFTQAEATNIRIFDPFVTETKCAPLVTPRMLTDRLEAYLADIAMPKAS